MDKEALVYHSKGRPGKIEVHPTKETDTQKDLALAYSPGVAAPCLAIEADASKVYDYTTKGNLVAVISNGTAVLGLGDIGPLASKPVMEGKAVLFKKFADIDVFDLELDTKDIEEFIRTVKILSPTFGGINLEDISAPDCFEIEERLKAELNIPIMHDDQHGTAIVSAAALLNALELTGKKIEDIKVVINGAGAAATSCASIYLALGVQSANLYMFDSKGLIHTDRDNLDGRKKLFTNQNHAASASLEEVLVGADMFLGLSKADILNEKMLLSMAKDCIVFALANPNPEISYDIAMQTRPDIIFATGRSDHPNQVNNVLGFPYIFRGALDVRATKINEAMKLAAVHALADLTKMPVPQEVIDIYGGAPIKFGPTYILPKPFDNRLLKVVSTEVSKAAIASGVAQLTEIPS
jgi:malate dehydrogenase (oxaloacetate-decarboxylating)(NADP+)